MKRRNKMGETRMFTVKQWQSVSTERRLSRIKEMEHYIKWCEKVPPVFYGANGEDKRKNWAMEEMARVKKSLELSPQVFEKICEPPWWENC